MKHLLMMIAFATVTLMVGVAAAQGEGRAYTLDSGDVILVSVYGLPDYPVEIQVDDSGIISLPVIGDVHARGKTRVDVRAEIAASLADTVMNNPRVQITIKQYRPFYIGGHVSEPGAHPYQPDITVRHAIAIAGGVKFGDSPAGMAAITIADLHARRERIQVEIFRSQARLARLHAEIDGHELIPPVAPEDAKIPPEITTGIIASERQLFEARRRGSTAHVLHMSEAIHRAAQEAKILEEALSERKHIQDLEHRALIASRKLEARSLVSGSRVRENEQKYSSATEQLRQLQIQLSAAQQRIRDLKRDFEGGQQERNSELLAQVQEAEQLIEGLNAERVLLARKIALLGGGGGLGGGAAGVRATIVRKSAPGSGRAEVELEEEVRPGDLIEILPPEPGSEDAMPPWDPKKQTPQAGFNANSTVYSQ